LVARTRVARTRLTPQEYDEFVASAHKAGINPAEYLRNLIVGRKDDEDIQVRLTSIEDRLLHVETEVARMWSQEGRQHDSQRT
jgi:hypothetical protein